LVRFCVTGASLKVPIAVNWLVWPGYEIDCEEGRIARESRGSDSTPFTVRVAVAVTTLAGVVEVEALLYCAVIVVVPWPTGVASPVAAPIVATAVLLEFQEAEFVSFTCRPVLPIVPIATNDVVGLVGVVKGIVTVCEPGMIASEVICCDDADAVTVSVPVPITIVPSGFEAIAVIAVVPFPTAVAIPVAGSIDATEGTLELHVAALIVEEPIVAV